MYQATENILTRGSRAHCAPQSDSLEERARGRSGKGLLMKNRDDTSSSLDAAGGDGQRAKFSRSAAGKACPDLRRRHSLCPLMSRRSCSRVVYSVAHHTATDVLRSRVCRASKAWHAISGALLVGTPAPVEVVALAVNDDITLKLSGVVTRRTPRTEPCWRPLVGTRVPRGAIQGNGYQCEAACYSATGSRSRRTTMPS